MKEVDVLKSRDEAQAAIEAVVLTIQKMAPQGDPSIPGVGLAQVYVYEANRRIEDVLHRVNDLASVLLRFSDERMDKLVADAAAKGNLRVVGPTEPEAK